MAVLGRTVAVFSKMVDDIKKIIHAVTIIVSCLFLACYVYNIITHILNFHIVYLIIYSLLFVIALVTFIIYLATYAQKKKGIEKAKRILRIIKYTLCSAMIGVNAYEIATMITSELSTILLIVSIISLIAQIVIEIIGVFAERYVKLMKISLEKDLEFFYKIAQLKDGKTTFWEFVDAPLEAIANKLQNKEPEPLSKDEAYVDNLAKEYADKKKEEFSAQQEEAKQRGEQTAEKQKGDVKEHFAIIRDKLKERFVETFTHKRNDK